MASIAGSCLCGAVMLTVARAPKSVTQCNCSTCRRYGTLWAYYKRSAVTIKGKLRDFTLRRGGLRFRSCATCSCIASWEHERGADATMGVNMRLFDHAAMARVPIAARRRPDVAQGRALHQAGDLDLADALG
jgi:hypothetical protein